MTYNNHNEPTNEELGIEPWPLWAKALGFIAIFGICVWVWYALLTALIEAVRTI